MQEGFAFARELLGLHAGESERGEADYRIVADLAAEYLRGGAEVISHGQADALTRFLYQVGDISLAARVSRFRRRALRPGQAVSPYDRLSIAYETLADFAFADLPPLVGSPPFAQSATGGTPKVLSFVYLTINYTENGYAIRTQSILENTSLAVRTYGRIGYPWAQELVRDREQRAATRYGGIEYRYFRGRVQNEYDVFRNLGVTKAAIRQLILEHQPDIVHAASNFIVGLPALLAARECQVPFVYEMRGQWELTNGAGVAGWFDRPRYAIDRRMEAYVAKSADGVIVLTNVHRRYVGEMGVAPERIDIVKNYYAGALTGSATEPAGDSSAIERLRASLAGKTVIGYVGSLTVYEGLQLVIDALADHLADLRHIVFLIVGDGSYRGALSARARERGVADRVVFAGRIAKAKVESLYGLIDVCVLPRLGLDVTEIVGPLKTLEVLAHGKPLLASNVAPIVEQTEWLGGGELFRHGDAADFAVQLRRILGNLDATRARYRDRAVDVLANASWTTGVSTWDDALKRVLARRRVAALETTGAAAGSTDALDALRRRAEGVATGALRQLRCLGEVRTERAAGDSFFLYSDCLDENVLIVAKGKAGKATRVRLVPESADNGRRRYQLFFDLVGPVAILLFVDPPFADALVEDGFHLIRVPAEGPPERIGGKVFRASRLFFCPTVLVENQSGRVEQFRIVSSLEGIRRFCLLGVPLDGADLSFLPYSPELDAPFQYAEIEPATMFLPNPFGTAGTYLVVFIPWSGAGAKRYRDSLLSIEARRIIDDQFTVDLDPRFVNVLIAAEIDENLIDGSVVWLKNIVNAVAASPKVRVFVATNSITLPNVLNREIFSQPNVVKLDLVPAATASERAETAYLVDRLSGGFDRCIVRGADLTNVFSRPPTRGRTDAYATPVVNAGLVHGDQPEPEAIPASRVRAVIFQGADLRDGFLRAFPNFSGQAITIPPTYDSGLADAPLGEHDGMTGSPCMVYAGKITREYGLLELLDAAKRLSRAFPDLRVHICGSKFDNDDPLFRQEFSEALAGLGEHAVWKGMASASEIYRAMRQADLFWGWRHAEFERRHSETSTKAVEAVGCGVPIVLYPSPTSLAILGKDYEGFAETANDIPAAMERLIGGGRISVAERFAKIAKPFGSDVAYREYLAGMPAPKGSRAKRLALVAHDFRFFEGIEARLLGRGWMVYRQVGKGHGELLDQGNSAELNAAGVVFCEWCLANAVWWSHHLQPGKLLIIRFHYQELVTDFPARVDYARVDRVIFISPLIMRQAIEKFGIPAEKCVCVPITVDLPAPTYASVEYKQKRNVVGLVGMVPWRKRIDLAVELFRRLRHRFPDLHLAVKGEMPSRYPWMAERGEELEKYRAAFAELAQLEREGRVTYFPYDDNMSGFYRHIGWILSTSDSEGCHTAVAEGGVAGAIPLMLPWPGASEVYPADYVQGDLDALVSYFADNYAEFAARSRLVQARFTPLFHLDHVFGNWERMLE